MKNLIICALLLLEVAYRQQWSDSGRPEIHPFIASVLDGSYVPTPFDPPLSASLPAWPADAPTELPLVIITAPTTLQFGQRLHQTEYG